MEANEGGEAELMHLQFEGGDDGNKTPRQQDTASSKMRRFMKNFVTSSKE